MGRAQRRSAFTLIEMMAAVAIFALLAALVAPRMASLSSRTLRERAQRMAGRIEFGRQRAAVTGLSHRLVIDIDAASYWLEEEGRPAPEEESQETPLDASGRPLLVLTPPDTSAGEWAPVRGSMGREEALEPSIRVAGLETADGWIDAGEAWVDLYRDGTASETWIHLEDDSGRGVVLEVQPLAEGVRIEDEEL